MTSNDLWTAEIAALANCDPAEAEAAVEKYSGDLVMRFVRETGDLPKVDLDALQQIATAGMAIVDIVKTAVEALSILGQQLMGTYKPTRYERIQRRIAERGPRRRKHGGRLAKLSKV